jgi:hypothetical protein
MKNIKLYTKDGKFVSEVVIPDFVSAPIVLNWGARYFVWSNSEQKYLEEFCYMIVRY